MEEFQLSGVRRSRMMVRQATDDFQALMTADAMERAGATVVSIAVTEQSRAVQGTHVIYTWHVFARVPPNVEISDVDAWITQKMKP